VRRFVVFKFGHLN